MVYVGHNVAADMDFCLIIQFVFRQPNTYHPREKNFTWEEWTAIIYTLLTPF